MCRYNICIDFEKAFDVVSHENLFYKLKSLYIYTNNIRFN